MFYQSVLDEPISPIQCVPAAVYGIRVGGATTVAGSRDLHFELSRLIVQHTTHVAFGKACVSFLLCR